MCGINGFWNLDVEDSLGADILKKMNSKIIHRGPDGEGVWKEGKIGLAHRRLAIIDLETGHQPMISFCNRYIISYNGEIYNYRELKSDLKAKGYSFNSDSDTEVIPYVIDAYGAKQGLNKLRGMFAFAIFDRKKQELLLARDYVGIKPLYYTENTKDAVYFGSEIKSLLSVGEVKKNVQYDSLIDFLVTGHTFSPKTFWSNIMELPPGSYMIFNQSSVPEVKKFWDWKYDFKSKTKGDWIDLIDETLKESVQAHLISDVPISSFLSGGVDSSLIAGMVCKYNIPNLNTFNAGFEEKKYDETKYAQIVSTHIGSNHFNLKVGLDQSDPSLLKHIIEQYDQPFGDSSAIPTFLISKEMANHSKVVLSGDGADELFLGYNRYQRIMDIDLLTKIPFSDSLLGFLALSSSMFSSNKSRQFKKLQDIVKQPYNNRIASQFTYFSTNELANILSPELLDYYNNKYLSGISKFLPKESGDVVQGLVETEINALLHADYLRKVDIASMQHSLEVRTPFLDKQVMELAMNIPIKLHLQGRTQKYLLKKVAERYVPHEAIYRSKGGFGIPFDTWANNKKMKEFIQDVLNSKSEINNFISYNYVNDLLNHFFHGSMDNANISRYQVYQRIFMLLSLELNLRKY